MLQPDLEGDTHAANGVVHAAKGAAVEQRARCRKGDDGPCAASHRCTALLDEDGLCQESVDTVTVGVEQARIIEVIFERCFRTHTLRLESGAALPAARGADT